MNIIDEIRSRANQQPNHPALICDQGNGKPEQVISYSDLVERMDNFADRLRQTHCNTGERVGLLAPQGIEFIEAGLGILAAGLCFVPISDDYDGDALEGFVNRTQLHYLIRQTDELQIQRFDEAGCVDGQEDEAFRKLQPAYIRFTSGTTNERKGVIIGHKTILERLENANQALNIEPEDKVMWMLPMAHHFVVSILLYLRYGATILLPRSYLAKPVLEFANTHSASVFYASPYHYDSLAKDVSGLGLPQVRLAVSTASGLGIDVAERFFNRMGVPLSQALGVIEVGLPVINIKRAKEKPLSLGQVLPAYDVWLRGEDGHPVSKDEKGEVCIRGKGIFDAYMDPWKPSSEIMGEDGFCTGDQGYFDEDGDLTLCGRRSNRINMAGMKFFAEEVEAVINTHPLVEESRVYGQSHPHLGEIPMAQIVPSDLDQPPSPTDLTSLCKQQLAAHKVPFSFNLANQLERTSTGKIKRW